MCSPSFDICGEKKNPLPTSRGQENSCGTTSVCPKGPHGALTGPQAVPGPTRLPLLFFREATPKGIPYPGFRCLAPPGSSLAKRLNMYWFSSSCSLYQLKFSLPPTHSLVNRNVQTISFFWQILADILLIFRHVWTNISKWRKKGKKVYAQCPLKITCLCVFL